MKIAVVTCYFQPDYVRARTLRTAIKAAPDTQVIIIKNRHKGMARFVEVPAKLMMTRLTQKPDAYVITFRGYEMLLLMVHTLVRKPIIFDEMVNFTEWMEENGKLKPGTLAYRLFRRWNGWMVGHARFVLADTDAHAKFSAKLNGLALDRYRTIPVGTDEEVFHPQAPSKSADKKFTVFYYGHMRPLHGLDYVLEAARLLKDQPDISFRFIGGKEKDKQACLQAASEGAHVTHESWLAFDELPKAAAQAGLTLGGPFGGTTQAKLVVTGKTYQFLALGTPVLIGRNEVNAHFENKVNSLVVDQADAQAIANAVTWAKEHPKELKKIGEKGRRLYEKHFSQDVINGLVEKLLQDI